MEITFLGAAGEVTGSCARVRTSGCTFLVDCGMFQGGREAHARNLRPWPFEPKQIELLKADAEKARRKEVQGVVGRIREAIDAYGLTAEDLGFSVKSKSAGKAAPAKKRGAKAKAKPAAVVKFRNDSGGTWGGLGKRPQWLRDALAAGKTLDDFKV